MSAQRHYYFFKQNNGIAGKGLYRTGREVLVFEAGLGICAWLKKQKIFMFYSFFQNFFISDIISYRG